MIFRLCFSKHMEMCVASCQCFIYFDCLKSFAPAQKQKTETLKQNYKIAIENCRTLPQPGFNLSRGNFQLSFANNIILGHHIAKHSLSSE